MTSAVERKISQRVEVLLGLWTLGKEEGRRTVCLVGERQGREDKSDRHKIENSDLRSGAWQNCGQYQRTLKDRSKKCLWKLEGFSETKADLYHCHFLMK